MRWGTYNQYNIFLISSAMQSNNHKLLRTLVKNSISLVKSYNIKESLESQCHNQGIVKTLN